MSGTGLERFAQDFTDDQLQIRDLMVRFAQDRLAPGAAERDKTHAYPHDLIDELGALGGMAMKAPVDGDDALADATAYVLAIEAISRADASVGVVMVASNLAASIIAAHASQDQRQRYLAPAVRGELGALSFALTEPGAGSDAAGITTRAVQDGDDWLLTGTKQWITGAAGARLFLVFARTPELGENAVTAFLVDKDTPGFTLGRIEDKLGLCSSGTAVLHFDTVRLSAEQVLGVPGQGYAAALSGIGASRLAIAAQSIGIAERALELGIAYAQDRCAFGTPLSSFQNSRYIVADSRTELDQAWLLMLRGARLLDRDGTVRSEASMAKLAASETCGRIVDRMLQLHGGNGYSREYEIERLYRDARVMRIFEGTSEIQREVIARALLGRADHTG